MVTAVMEREEKFKEDTASDSKKRRLSSILTPSWTSPDTTKSPTPIVLPTMTKPLIWTPKRANQSNGSNDNVPYTAADEARFKKLKEFCKDTVPDSFLHACFKAGYDTQTAITAMNVNLSDKRCDFKLIERYNNHQLPPGHKQAFARFVNDVNKKQTSSVKKSSTLSKSKRKHNQIDGKPSKSSSKKAAKQANSRQSNSPAAHVSKKQKRKNKNKTDTADESTRLTINPVMICFEVSNLDQPSLESTIAHDQDKSNKKKKAKRTKRRRNKQQQRVKMLTDSDIEMQSVSKSKSKVIKEVKLEQNEKTAISTSSINPSTATIIESNTVDQDAALELLTVSTNSNTNNNDSSSDNSSDEIKQENNIGLESQYTQIVRWCSSNSSDSSDSSSDEESDEKSDIGPLNALIDDSNTAHKSMTSTKKNTEDGSLNEHVDQDRRARIALAADALVIMASTNYNSIKPRRAVTTLSQMVSSGQYNPLTTRTNTLNSEPGHSKAITKDKTINTALPSSDEEEEDDDEEMEEAAPNNDQSNSESDTSSDSSSSDDDDMPINQLKLRIAGQRTTRKRRGDLFDLANDMK
ncbi:hypothetical protein BDF19DRAFT_486981 [Syncephalis fuscata]|nr:hypothetical protein BDF19DRAFT_486981 [Syncephalis fuscata]